MSYASKKAAKARSKTMLGSAAYAPWTPPFRYNEMGCWIEDAHGHRFLDLRGWGYLTGKGCGALGMDQDAAALIQDRVGRRAVELLNEDALDPAWTQTPPTEQGEYWHWNGEQDCAPYQLCVMYSGASGKHFVCIKDDDQTRFVDDPQWAGWWKRILEPKLPNNSTVRTPLAKTDSENQ